MWVLNTRTVNVHTEVYENNELIRRWTETFNQIEHIFFVCMLLFVHSMEFSTRGLYLMVLVLLLDFEYSRNIFELDKVAIKSIDERISILESLNGSNFHILILKLQTVSEVVLSTLQWLSTYLSIW